MWHVYIVEFNRGKQVYVSKKWINKYIYEFVLQTVIETQAWTE